MSTFDNPHLPDEGIRGEGEIHPEEVKNPEVNYDRTDMSAKAIVGFLIFLAIAGVFMHLILWGIYKSFAENYKGQAGMAPYSPSGIMTTTRQLPKGDPERTFPPPRLQSDDVADMNKFRAEEEQILNSYDWVDQNAGVVRVPIESAVQALAQQGLPTREATPFDFQVEQSLTPAPGSGGAMTEQRVAGKK